MRILLTWFLFCGVCSAQWDTSIWPAWTVKKKGREQAEEVYNALVERRKATWGARDGSLDGYPDGFNLSQPAPSAPSWWRFQKFMLGDYKDALKGMISRYVISVTNFQDALKPYDYGLYYSMVDSEQLLYHQTVTGLLVACSLPTNYFTYTPWRCLSGLGPFTNDASVGHGYGWSNSYTEAGGMNFPDGRSVWYTTDYGWNGMPLLINELNSTESLSHWYITNSTDNLRANRGYEESGDPPTRDWELSKQECEDTWGTIDQYWADSHGDNSKPQSFTRDDTIYAYARARFNDVYVIASPDPDLIAFTNGIGGTYEVMVSAGQTNEYATHGDITNGATWTFNGPGLSTSNLNVIATGKFEGTNEYIKCVSFGSFSFPSEWCRENPFSGIYAPDVEKGWKIGEGDTAVITWNFAYTNTTQ